MTVLIGKGREEGERERREGGKPHYTHMARDREKPKSVQVEV